MHPLDAWRRRLRHFARIGVGHAVLCSAQAAIAEPTAATCGQVGVSLEGSFNPVWSGAAEAACAHLGELTDRDPGASLTLNEAPDSTVRVSLRLADGRRTERMAREPGELSRVMEALVTLPPRARLLPQVDEDVEHHDDAPPPAPKAEAPHPSALSPAIPPPTGADSMQEREAGNVPLAVDVTALTVGRVSGGPAHVGVGLVGTANLDIDHGWLAGLRARADVANFNVEDDGELDGASFGGGIELGRRISVSDVVAFDLGVGADALADMRVEDGRSNGRRGRDADEVEGDVRPRVFAKAWIHTSRVSFAALLGFEVSPLRIDDHHDLPAYGGEAGFGVGWSGL